MSDERPREERGRRGGEESARERRRPPDDDRNEERRRTRDDGHGDRQGGPPRRGHRVRAGDAASRAAQQLRDLTGRTVEGVTGVEPGDDGWTVTVEVLETARIPNTSDVLAEYEVGIDADGGLLSYRRRDRYTRGSTRGE